MSKIPTINIKATDLIGALINEYDCNTHQEILNFLNHVKILNCANHKNPIMNWDNFKKIKIINNKSEHKKQQVYQQKIDFSVVK